MNTPVMAHVTSAPLFRFQEEALIDIAKEHAQVYQSAQPFPHISLDGLFSEELLDLVLAELPTTQREETEEWASYNDYGTAKKRAIKKESQIGSVTLHLIQQLHSSAFVSFLEVLTGIKGLIPDPHYSGGGIHLNPPGAYLKMHVDFNRNKRLDLERRLNLILFLNKEWKEEYGGHLELWNKDMTACESKILPIYNRIGLFSTSPTSYHGHPDPVLCPPGMERKTIALYYYSKDRPAEEKEEDHNTIFVARPGVDPDSVNTSVQKAQRAQREQQQK